MPNKIRDTISEETTDNGKNNLMQKTGGVGQGAYPNFFSPLNEDEEDDDAIPPNGELYCWLPSEANQRKVFVEGEEICEAVEIEQWRGNALHKARYVPALSLKEWLPDLVLEDDCYIPLSDLLTAIEIHRNWTRSSPDESRRTPAEQFIRQLNVKQRNWDYTIGTGVAADMLKGFISTMDFIIDRVNLLRFAGSTVTSGTRYPQERKLLRTGISKPPVPALRLDTLAQQFVLGIKVLADTGGLVNLSRSRLTPYEHASYLRATDRVFAERSHQNANDGFPDPIDAVFNRFKGSLDGQPCSIDPHVSPVDEESSLEISIARALDNQAHLERYYQDMPENLSSGSGRSNVPLWAALAMLPSIFGKSITETEVENGAERFLGTPADGILSGSMNSVPELIYVNPEKVLIVDNRDVLILLDKKDPTPLRVLLRGSGRASFVFGPHYPEIGQDVDDLDELPEFNVRRYRTKESSAVVLTVDGSFSGEDMAGEIIGLEYAGAEMKSAYGQIYFNPAGFLPSGDHLYINDELPPEEEGAAVVSIERETERHRFIFKKDFPEVCINPKLSSARTSVLALCGTGRVLYRFTAVSELLDVQPAFDWIQKEIERHWPPVELPINPTGNIDVYRPTTISFDERLDLSRQILIIVRNEHVNVQIKIDENFFHDLSLEDGEGGVDCVVRYKEHELGRIQLRGIADGFDASLIAAFQSIIDDRKRVREKRFGLLPKKDVGSLDKSSTITESAILAFGAYRPYQTKSPKVGRDYPGVVFTNENAQLFYEFSDECPELYVRRVGSEIIFYVLEDDRPILSVAPLATKNFAKLANIAEIDVRTKWPDSELDTVKNPIGSVSVKPGQRIIFGTPVFEAWKSGKITRLNLPGEGAGQVFAFTDPRIRLARHDAAGTGKEKYAATFVNPETLSPIVYLHSENPYYLEEQAEQIAKQQCQMGWNVRGDVVVENDSFFIFMESLRGTDFANIEIANHAAKIEFSFPLSNIYLTCIDRDNQITCSSPDGVVRLTIRGKGRDLSPDKCREIGRNLRRHFVSMYMPFTLANDTPFQVPETLSKTQWWVLNSAPGSVPGSTTISVPKSRDGHLSYRAGESALDNHLLLEREDSEDGKFLLIEGQPEYIAALRSSFREKEKEAEVSSFDDYQYGSNTAPFLAVAGDHIYEVGSATPGDASGPVRSSARNGPMTIYLQKGNVISISYFPKKGISIRMPAPLDATDWEACIDVPAALLGNVSFWLAQENIRGFKAVINASGRAEYVPWKTGDPEAFIVFRYEIGGNIADFVIEGTVEAVLGMRRKLMEVVSQKSRAIYTVLGSAHDAENLAHLHTVKNQLVRISPYAWVALTNAGTGYDAASAKRDIDQLIEHAQSSIEKQSNGKEDIARRANTFHDLKAILWFASKVDNKRGLLEHARQADWKQASNDIYIARSKNAWSKHIDATRERAIFYGETRSSLIGKLRAASETFVPNVMGSLINEAWMTSGLYYKNSANLLMHAWAMWTLAENLENGSVGGADQNLRFLVWARKRNPDLQTLIVDTSTQTFKITIAVPRQVNGSATQYEKKEFVARMPLIYTRENQPHYDMLKAAAGISFDEWEQILSEAMPFDELVLFIGKFKNQQEGDARDLSTATDEGIRDQAWLRHYSDIALDDPYLSPEEVQVKNPRGFLSIAENVGIVFDEPWGGEEFTAFRIDEVVSALTVLFQGRRNYLTCCRDSPNVLGYCSPEGKLRAVFFSIDGKVLPLIKQQVEQQMAQLRERIFTLHSVEKSEREADEIRLSPGSADTEIHEIRGGAENTTLGNIPKAANGRLAYEDVTGLVETGGVSKFVLKSTALHGGGYRVIQGEKKQVRRLYDEYAEALRSSEPSAFLHMQGKSDDIEFSTRRDFQYTVGSPGIFGESLLGRTVPMVLVTKPNSRFVIDDLPPGGLGFDVSNAQLTPEQYATHIDMRGFLRSNPLSCQLLLPPMGDAEIHVTPTGFEYRDGASESKSIAVFRCEVTDWNGKSPVTRHSDIFIRGWPDDVDELVKDIQRQINEAKTQDTLRYGDLSFTEETLGETATLDTLERRLRSVSEECDRVLNIFGAYDGVDRYLMMLKALRNKAEGADEAITGEDVAPVQRLKQVGRMREFIASCDFIAKTKDENKDLKEVDWWYGLYRWAQEHKNINFRNEKDEFNSDRIREMTNMAVEASIARLQFEVFSEKAGWALMKEYVEPHRHQTLLKHDLEFVLKADKLSRLSAYLNQGSEDARTAGTIALIEAKNPKIKSLVIDYQEKRLAADVFKYVPLLFNAGDPVRMKPHFRGEFKLRPDVFEKIRKALPKLESLGDEDIRSYDWDAFFKEIVNVTPLDLEEDTKAQEEAETEVTGGDVFNAAADAIFATQGERIAGFIQALNKKYPVAGQAAMYVGGAAFGAYVMGKLGAAIGSILGPGGMVIGGAVGATIGAGAGAFGAYSVGKAGASGGGMPTTVTKGVSEEVGSTLRESGAAVGDLGGLWGAGRDASDGWSLVNAAGNLLVASKSVVTFIQVKGGYLLATYGTALDYAGKTGKVLVLVYASKDCVEGAGDFLENKTMGSFLDGTGKCAVAFSTVMGAPGMGAAQAKLAKGAVEGTIRARAAQAFQAAIDLEDKAMAGGVAGILFGTVTKAAEEAVDAEEQEIYQEIVEALEQHDKETTELEAKGIVKKLDGERHSLSPEKLRLLEYAIRHRSKKRLGSGWKYSRLRLRG